MRHALLIAAALAAQPAATVTLQVRVFNGADDVSAATRVVVFRAGDRQAPVAASPGGGALEAVVPSGIYDAQAIWEKDGQVRAIRWAERLVVMPYPDEAGTHLEVINFQPDYGALLVSDRGAGVPDVAIFVPGSREKETAVRLVVGRTALFVVPAGAYDLRVRRGGEAWYPGIDVPRDRTRFWIVP